MNNFLAKELVFIEFGHQLLHFFLYKWNRTLSPDSPPSSRAGNKKRGLCQNYVEQKRDIEHYQKIRDSLTANFAKNRKAQIFLAYAEEIKAWLEPTCRENERKIRESLEAEVNKISRGTNYDRRRYRNYFWRVGRSKPC